MDKATHVYIGTKTCGCRVAACVDDGTADCRRDVRDMDKRGLIITREALADGPISVNSCKHRADNTAILESLKPTKAAPVKRESEAPLLAL